MIALFYFMVVVTDAHDLHVSLSIFSPLDTVWYALRMCLNFRHLTAKFAVCITLK